MGPWRSIVFVLVGSALVLGAMGCAGDGSEGDTGPSVVPALRLTGDAARGEEVWAKAGCGACHALTDANASGTVASDLDRARPTFERSATLVTTGVGTMPAYDRRLTDQEIADVAEYVATSTRA